MVHTIAQDRQCGNPYSRHAHLVNRVSTLTLDCLNIKRVAELWWGMQVSVLQTLADEKCLHLMPPLELAVLDRAAYHRQSTGDSLGSGQHTQFSEQRLQHILEELQQAGMLERCHATQSLIKDL